MCFSPSSMKLGTRIISCLNALRCNADACIFNLFFFSSTVCKWCKCLAYLALVKLILASSQSHTDTRSKFHSTRSAPLPGEKRRRLKLLQLLVNPGLSTARPSKHTTHASANLSRCTNILHAKHICTQFRKTREALRLIHNLDLTSTICCDRFPSL